MKNSFWNYFKNILNWPLLKSHYLQVIVKGLGLYFDEIRSDIILVREQYFAELSDSSRLSDYATSRGIKRLNADTDSSFRTRIINAYRWLKYAGKETGLPVILKEYGYDGARVEYFDEPEKWAEFAVAFNCYGQDTTGIVHLINESKPARSKLGLLKTPAHVDVWYSIAGYASTIDTIYSVKKAPEAVLCIVGYTTLTDSIISLKGD